MGQKRKSARLKDMSASAPIADLRGLVGKSVKCHQETCTARRTVSCFFAGAPLCYRLEKLIRCEAKESSEWDAGN